jgi:thiamine kinase-like enzyme
MYVIDWELSHVTSPAFDLGQMLGDLFETRHFTGIEAGAWLMDAFMEGYGKLNEDLAFKTAIQVGAHLICWGSRLPAKERRNKWRQC